MIIFLYGPETFLSRRKLNEIVAKKTAPPAGGSGGFNVFRLPGGEFELLKLKETVESVSIFETKKIIILENIFGAGFQALGEIAEFILSKKLADDRNNLLIFLEGGVGAQEEKSALFKILTKKPALSQKFENLNPRQIKNWILKETEARGGKISSEALDFLSSSVGNDLWRASQELDKLIVYKNGGTVSLADVKTLVVAEFNFNIFDLTDALGRKDRKTALRIFDGETRAGRDELEILGMIAGHFRRLISLRSLAEAGRTATAAALGFHPFVFQKVSTQSRNFILADLKNKFRKIVETDFMIKTGKIDKRAGLEMLIFNLAN